MKKIIISVVLLLLSICCFCEEVEYFNVVVLDKNSRELLDNKVEYREASVSLKDTTGNIVLITNDISFNKNKEDIFYIPLDYLKNKEIIINTEDKTDTYNSNHIVILAKTDYEGPFCDNNANKFLSFTKENNGETITYGVAKFYRNVDNNHHIKAIEDAKNDGLESIKQTSPQDVNVFSRTTEIINYDINDTECCVTTIMKYDDSYKKINLDYTKDEFEIKDKKLISYNRSNTSVTIPDGVEEISAGAFQSNESIMEVIIPNTCKKIDDYAFNGCHRLEKVNLENIDEIGQSAFSYCLDLRKNINLSNKIESISYGAFSNCNIFEITIPDSVKIIDKFAFLNNSNLNKLTLNNNLNTIGHSAFACYRDNPNKSLNELIIPNSVETIQTAAFLNTINLSKITLGKNLKSIGDLAFCGHNIPNNSLKELIIPDSVEYIGNYAFGDMPNLSKLTLGENLKIIDKHAFSCNEKNPNNSLTELIIPDNVEIIGFNAFGNMPKLSKLILGKNLKIIDKFAFYNNENTPNKLLKELSIPNSVEIIGKFAFCNTPNLAKLFLNKNLKYIGNYAFCNDEIIPNECLTELSIPDSVEEIGICAFFNYPNLSKLTLSKNLKIINELAFGYPSKTTNLSLTELIIPDTVKIIGSNAFSNMQKLSKLTLGKNIKIIGKNAFGCSDISPNNSLTELIIPNSVEEICRKAFFNLTNLTNLTLSNNLKKIGDGAFACSPTNPNKSLKELIIPDSVEEIGEYAFQCISNISKLTLSKNLKVIEKATFVNTKENPNTSLTELIIPDSVEIIEKGAFQFIPNLSKLILGKNLKKIKNSAFVCSSENPNLSLTELTIPDSVEIIEKSAFLRLSNLTKLTLGKNLKIIGNGAFGCSPTNPNKSLKELIIPDSVETIEAGAFQCMPNISKLTLGKNIKLIEEDAFHCLIDNPNTSLKELIIPNSVEIIGKFAFANMQALSNIVLGKNVKEIQEGAFYNNISLKELIIPDSVEIIGAGAFQNTSNISKLILGKNIKTIESQAFESTKIPNKNLKELIITDSVEIIGNSAFGNYTNLSKLELGKSIQLIDKLAFACSNNNPNQSLKELIIPDTVIKIGKQAFYNITNLSKLILSKNLTEIDEAAFGAFEDTPNNSLTNIIIPKSTKIINPYTFVNCKSIQHVLMPKMDNEKEIFAGCNENLKIEYYK